MSSNGKTQKPQNSLQAKNHNGQSVKSDFEKPKNQLEEETSSNFRWSDWNWGLFWSGFEGKTIWNWLQLLVIPLFFASLTFYWQERENHRLYKLEKYRYNQQLVKDYTQSIQVLLLDKYHHEDFKYPAILPQEVASFVKSYTATTLKALDGDLQQINVLTNFLKRSEIGFVLESSDDQISTDICDLNIKKDPKAKPINFKDFLCKINLEKAELKEINLSRSILGEALLSEANLRKAYLDSSHLRKAYLVKADLKNASLVAVDLTEADLRGANLTKANLGSAKLSGSKLSSAIGKDPFTDKEHERKKATLKGAILRYADLTDADLTDADLKGTDLKYANLRGANLTRADLRGADLTHANLRGSILKDTRIRQTKLDGALFDSSTQIEVMKWFAKKYRVINEETIIKQYEMCRIGPNQDLTSCHLRRADLSGADLTGADLRKVDLQNVNLRNVVLTGANLIGVDLTKADLRGASLKDANLKDANLKDADLTGADLTDAILENAIITDAKLED